MKETAVKLFESTLANYNLVIGYLLWLSNVRCLSAAFVCPAARASPFIVSDVSVIVWPCTETSHLFHCSLFPWLLLTAPHSCLNFHLRSLKLISHSCSFCCKSLSSQTNRSHLSCAPAVLRGYIVSSYAHRGCHPTHQGTLIATSLQRRSPV